MKEKIIAQLRAKYPGVNLSKTRMDAIADKLSAKITDEKDIDAKLDELNDIMPFADIAKQDDRLRTLETKSKEKPPVDDEHDDPKPPKRAKEDDAPAWAKALIDKVNAFEKKEQQQTISQKLHAKLKEKNIPLMLAKGRSVEKEEDLDTLVTELEADHTAYKQELANQGLGGSQTPLGGSGIPIKSDAVDADIDAWASKGKEKATV